MVYRLFILNAKKQKKENEEILQEKGVRSSAKILKSVNSKRWNQLVKTLRSKGYTVFATDLASDNIPVSIILGSNEEAELRKDDLYEVLKKLRFCFNGRYFFTEKFFTETE